MKTSDGLVGDHQTLKSFDQSTDRLFTSLLEISDKLNRKKTASVIKYIQCFCQTSFNKLKIYLFISKYLTSNKQRVITKRKGKCLDHVVTALPF